MVYAYLMYLNTWHKYIQFKSFEPSPSSVSHRQDDVEKTAECFQGDFYLTGDRGFQDQDGYLWFVGRADDVILSAG